MIIQKIAWPNRAHSFSSLTLFPPSLLFLSLSLDWSNRATLAQLGLLFMISTIFI
jgi:hypothetical protein